jgi:hypothetical protein
MKVIVAFCLALVITACVNEKEEGVVVSDATLFDLSKNISSFSFYKNKPDTLPADSSSPHFFFVRVRFNPKAASVMNDSLSALTAASFPDESMIVKEVYDNKGGALQRLDIMYKLRNAANNGLGWVWSEMNADGSVVTSAALKGDQCASCHSAGTNSDLVKTFGLH